ncbi:MAG: Rab family GTPase [Promethearchaeia archaeon]
MYLAAKILNVGESGVGKSTLIYRFINGIFIENINPTIGIEVFIKEFNYNNNEILLQLWDFSGQPQFKHMWHQYAIGALGATITFDLVNINTLKHIKEWVDICRKFDKELPILLIGAKSDLKNSIDDSYIIDLTSKYNLFNYIKVSAKSGENIELAFKFLVREILNRGNKFNYISKRIL